MRRISCGFLLVAGGLLALGLVSRLEKAEARVLGSAVLREAPLRGQMDVYPKVVELTPPDGVTLDTGASVESRTDRTGTLFVAATGRTKKGSGAVVWKQVPRPGNRWVSVAIDLGRRFEGGRGSLSVEDDGFLYLTVWGKPGHVYRVRIPGWVPGDWPK